MPPDVPMLKFEMPHNAKAESKKCNKRYYRTAESKHLSHQFLTPKTVALPSSLRSVPSGLPMVIAKIQNDAEIHAATATPALKNGAARYTMINEKGLYLRSTSSLPDSTRSIFRWYLKAGEMKRMIEFGRSQVDRHRCNGVRSKRGTSINRVYNAARRQYRGSSNDSQT